MLTQVYRPGLIVMQQLFLAVPIRYLRDAAANPERLSRYMRNTLSVKVLERRDRWYRTQWASRLLVASFTRDFEWTEINEWWDEPPRRYQLNFKQQSGEFNRYDGNLVIVEEVPFHNIVKVHVDYDWGGGRQNSFVQKALLKGIAEHHWSFLESMYTAARQQIDRDTDRFEDYQMEYARTRPNTPA
ncbi:MAG: hypothetical protein ACREJQ_02365 [bacterium]